MNITVINGQSHKGSSWHMGDQLVESLGKGNQITEFFLPKDFGQFCIGCGNCMNKGAAFCPHQQSLQPILQAIDQADLLVFTTPTYAYHTTGAMKALLDHLSWRWMSHRPEPSAFRKQAVILAASAGSTSRHAIRDIKDSLTFWGMGKIYTFGIPVWAASWEEISPKKRKKIDRWIAGAARQIQKTQGHVTPTLFQKFFFAMMRGVQKHPWSPLDGQWWKEKGLLEGKRPWQ